MEPISGSVVPLAMFLLCDAFLKSFDTIVSLNLYLQTCIFEYIIRVLLAKICQIKMKVTVTFFWYQQNSYSYIIQIFSNQLVLKAVKTSNMTGGMWIKSSCIFPQFNDHCLNPINQQIFYSCAQLLISRSDKVYHISIS